MGERGAEPYESNDADTLRKVNAHLDEGRPVRGLPPQVVDETDRAVEAWTVAEALNRLSPSHREVLVECFYAGRSVAEAAQRLGVPPGTVKSRTYYALRSLKVALEELADDFVAHDYDLRRLERGATRRRRCRQSWAVPVLPRPAGCRRST